jgi:hypothetical protein
MFNTAETAVFKLNKMRDSYARLLRAASELKGLETPAAVANALDITDQVIQNWKTRGVPANKLNKIEEKIGALPRWIDTGEGDMVLSRQPSKSDLTQEQKHILSVMEGIQPEARTALLHAVSLLTKPQSEHGVKEAPASVKSGRRPHFGIPKTKRLPKADTKLKRDTNG